MNVSKLYQVKQTNYQGNSGIAGGVIVKGAGGSVQMLGSKTKPSAQADMVDLANGTLLTTGAHSLFAIPEWIYFIGTADSIELLNYEEVDELGALA